MTSEQKKNFPKKNGKVHTQHDTLLHKRVRVSVRVCVRERERDGVKQRVGLLIASCDWKGGVVWGVVV